MSSEPSAMDRLERHALVMAIWSPSAVGAAALMHRGLSVAGPWWIAAGFGAILAAFCAHIIINVVTQSRFTAGETALGAFAFAVAVLMLLFGRLVGGEGVDASVFIATGLGLASLVAAVIVYLLIAHGPRGAFARFDVIRDNNPRAASRLPHRGGRR